MRALIEHSLVYSIHYFHIRPIQRTLIVFSQCGLCLSQLRVNSALLYQHNNVLNIHAQTGPLSRTFNLLTA